jgi:hypothetical protein
LQDFGINSILFCLILSNLRLDPIEAFNKCAPSVPVIAMSGFMFRDSVTPAPDFLTMATKLGAAYRTVGR